MTPTFAEWLGDWEPHRHEPAEPEAPDDPFTVALRDEPPDYEPEDDD